MSERITDEQVEEILARAEKATEGPWRTGWLESYNASTGEREMFIYRLSPSDEEETPGNRICIRGSKTKMDCVADADFIVHARTDVPALCGEVKRLRGELKTECDAHTLAHEQWQAARAERDRLKGLVGRLVEALESLCSHPKVHFEQPCWCDVVVINPPRHTRKCLRAKTALEAAREVTK